jgi:hypothetical protein
MEVIVYPPVYSPDQAEPGALQRRVPAPKTTHLYPDDLAEEVNRFLTEFNIALLDDAHHGFIVDEIEMQVTVTAEGKVQLIVGSASASGAIGIKIKLKRRDKA